MHSYIRKQCGSLPAEPTGIDPEGTESSEATSDEEVQIAYCFYQLELLYFV